MSNVWAKLVTAVALVCSVGSVVALNITANNLSEITCIINGGDFDRSSFAGFSQCLVEATPDS